MGGAAGEAALSMQYIMCGVMESTGRRDGAQIVCDQPLNDGPGVTGPARVREGDQCQLQLSRPFLSTPSVPLLSPHRVMGAPPVTPEVGEAVRRQRERHSGATVLPTVPVEAPAVRVDAQENPLFEEAHAVPAAPGPAVLSSTEVEVGTKGSRGKAGGACRRGATEGACRACRTAALHQAGPPARTPRHQQSP